MNIPVNTIILEIDGTDAINESGTVMTLGEVLLKALLTPIKSDTESTPEAKLKLWDLAKPIQEARTGSGVLTITLDDATFLKKRVGTVFVSAVVIGRVNEIFEGSN